jgi:hypothetical protein
MKYDPVEIARQFLFVREAGQNTGQRVEAIQHWSGGAEAHGTSWCCWFVTMVLDLCFQGASPIPRGGVCETVHQLAIANGWLSDTPEIGALYFYVDATGHAHHIGFVTSLDPLEGIAGNTSEDGASSNGDRVAEHAIRATVFANYPRD